MLPWVARIPELSSMIGGSLSGSDVFQLLLDKAMRNAGQPGNISRILFRFQEGTQLADLQEKLLGSPVLMKVNSVRFNTRLLGVPKWSAGQPNLQESIIFHKELIDQETEQ